MLWEYEYFYYKKDNTNTSWYIFHIFCQVSTIVEFNHVINKDKIYDFF